MTWVFSMNHSVHKLRNNIQENNHCNNIIDLKILGKLFMHSKR